MSKKDEALKLALEALEDQRIFTMRPDHEGKELTPAKVTKAISALREALAEQPAQQEQGDSICQEDDGCPTELAVLQRFWRGQSIPYEHYPTWCKPAPVPEPCKHEPVDSEEKAGAYMEARLWEFIDMAAAWPKASPDPRTWDHVVVYAPKPAQQEPEIVERIKCRAGQTLRTVRNPNITARESIELANWIVANTAPPAAQRTWVGLTDEEIDKTHETKVWDARRSYARAIEAKLKEKNT